MNTRGPGTSALCATKSETSGPDGTGIGQAVLIRPEQPGDAGAIDRVTIEAFEHVPRSSRTEQFIVRALRAGAALSVSLVADLQGEIVGHVAVSPVRVSDGATGWYGLGPVSVRPRYQRGGIGSRLIHAAIERLNDMSARGCVLLGNPGYYQRFGFKAVADLVLPGSEPAHFLALSFGPDFAKGRVGYHEAFDAVA